MDIICIQQPSKSSVPFIMLIERKTQTGIFKDPRDYNAILGCIPLYVVFIYGKQHYQKHIDSHSTQQNSIYKQTETRYFLRNKTEI